MAGVKDVEGSVQLVNDHDEVVLSVAQSGDVNDKRGALLTAIGAIRILGPFPFTYNTDGLTTGVTIYTPTAGDLLFDYWIRVTKAFNGTTPSADIGTFTGSAGIGDSFVGPIDLTKADSVVGSNAGLSYSLLSLSLGSSQIENIREAAALRRAIPIRFDNTNPLKLVVSQDGTKGGTATGATAGAGAVYLAIARPSLT